MIRHSARAALVAASALLAAGLAGCAGQNNTVVIEYTPLFNVPDTNDQGQQVGIYMVYCIVAIQNTGANAIDFQFDPARLYVQPEYTIVQNGYYYLYPLTVAAGHTAKNPGTLSIHATGAGTTNQMWVPLYYNTIGNESVLSVQEPPNPVPIFSPNIQPQCPDPSVFGS